MLFAHTGCSSHLIPKLVLLNMFPKSWLGDKKGYCVGTVVALFMSSTHIAARNSAVDVTHGNGVADPQQVYLCEDCKQPNATGTVTDAILRKGK